MRNKGRFLQTFCCILILGILGGCSHTAENVITTDYELETPSAVNPAEDETSDGEQNNVTEAVPTVEISIEGQTSGEDQTPQEEQTSGEAPASEETSGKESGSTSESAEPSVIQPPIQTGIFTYGLSHPEFLQVRYAGDETEYDTGKVYNGGNQSWFYNSNTGEGDMTLENEGCGLVAVSDTLLYLSMYHDGYENLTAPSVFAEGSPIDYNSYKTYVLGLRAREDLFPFSIQFGGALGTSLAGGVAQYGKEQGYRIQAKWGGRSEEAHSADYVNETSAAAMLSAFFEPEELEDKVGKFQWKTNTILYMLQQDIPVVMAVGPFSEMNLYQYSPESENEGKPVSVGTVGSHYFIVTGAVVDFDTMQIWMQIETWGETYVIDYLEFSEEIYSGMAYLSDILYIELNKQPFFEEK